MVKTSQSVRITSIAFQHYKAFARYSVSLEHINILTGANNSGKSTVIGSLRTLAVALRSARSRKPERVTVGDERLIGYAIRESLLPISLENVATNYADGVSRVSFRLSNGNHLHLYFDREGCVLVPETTGAAVTSPATFKSNFPIELAVVPVLGPVEHREDLREVETIAASLATHRASRHFRNYWHHFPAEFDQFAELVESTWPGMRVHAPEVVGARELAMFVSEDRIDRELYWVGFGFQIWCQLLTHLHRAASATLIVVDEPEVYLHPDIQRRLVAVLKEVGPDVLIATHSTEIIAEADPADLVLVDKARASAERIKDVAGVQRAMTVLGSQQNITLAALARNRRVLFVEGDYDFALIRRLARRLGMNDLAAGLGLASMPSGGFGSWERVSVLADGVEQALGTELLIGAVYDRDYFCDEQIGKVMETLQRSLKVAHVHSRKEIENYLLVPAALDRALARAVVERRSKGVPVPEATQCANGILMQLCDDLKDETEQQCVSRYSEFFKGNKSDLSTLMKEASSRFRRRWAEPEQRLCMVGGKEILRRFRERIQTEFGVSITDAKIIDALHQDDMPSDLVGLLNKIDGFRQAKVLSS
jgi:AAA domain, putative AbiEii toxin, Type IV TA system